MLKVGDKIRITGVPIPDRDGYISPETVTVFKKLVARNRPVRINKIDEYGTPWYCCRFKTRYGWEWHYLGVYPGEDNWVLVKKRK